MPLVDRVHSRRPGLGGDDSGPYFWVAVDDIVQRPWASGQLRGQAGQLRFLRFLLPSNTEHPQERSDVLTLSYECIEVAAAHFPTVGAPQRQEQARRACRTSLGCVLARRTVDDATQSVHAHHENVFFPFSACDNALQGGYGATLC